MSAPSAISPPLDRPARPLAWRLAGLAIVASVLPLAAVGYAVYDVNARTLEERSREFQLAVAGDIARAIRAERSAAVEGLVAIRRVLIEGDAPDDARLAWATALVEGDEALDHVVVHAPSGEVIDILREEGVELAASEPLAEAVRAMPDDGALARFGAIAFGAPHRVQVVLPITVDGRTTGFVSTAMSLAPIDARVEQLTRAYFAELPRPLRVVDLERRVLAGEREGPVGAPIDSPALAQYSPSVHAAGAAPSAAFEEDGVEWVAAVVPVPESDWAVLVQQPAEVVYRSLGEIARIVAGTVLIAIALALLVALVSARRITAPLGLLVDFARRLATRDFDARVSISTRDELAVVGRALNRAAGELRASEDRLAEAAAVRADLGRYLPAELVDRVVAREQDMALGGRRQQITILFADVVGFTPLSERLPPETVVAVLNELFTLLTEIVFRHGGIIDKFIGDCVMAVWGAPEPDADHAARALAAAEDMVRWIEVSSEGWRETHGVELALAIGVNTGAAVVGNVGSERRMEYTAIGDAVNVAARLEGIARPNQILVTEAVKDAAGDGFDYAFIDERRVTGRTEQLRLYEVQP